MYAGVYIFEGIDNVGKTTIIQALHRKIKDERDDHCIALAFPGHEPRTLGSLVYHIHHHIEDYFDKPVNEASLQLLHIAAHIDLIQRKLIPLSKEQLYCPIGSFLVVNIYIWFGWRGRDYTINYCSRGIVLEKYRYKENFFIRT